MHETLKNIFIVDGPCVGGRTVHETRTFRENHDRSGVEPVCWYGLVLNRKQGFETEEAPPAFNPTLDSIDTSIIWGT